ncbi:hypothetical protein ACHAWF_000975 [Thalassiosira exigua]
MFGYHPEPDKSWAICPLGSEAKAKAAFEAEGLKVEEWTAGVEALAKISARYPQSAYKGFTDSLQAEWQYLCCCVPGVEAYLQLIEDAIREKLFPALLDGNLDALVHELEMLATQSLNGGARAVDAEKKA